MRHSSLRWLLVFGLDFFSLMFAVRVGLDLCVLLLSERFLYFSSQWQISWFSVCRFLTEQSSGESDETSVMCFFEQIISCVCLYQRIVFDQASSHCVAVSRLTSGVKTPKKPQDVISICGSSQCVQCSYYGKKNWSALG